jgi:hypothetical protein
VSKKADRTPAKPQVARKYAGNTRGKPFQAGNPGRPKGSKNATTLLMESLLDGQAQALTQKAIELALTGDMAALRLCLERVLPPRKDRPDDLLSSAHRVCI